MSGRGIAFPPHLAGAGPLAWAEGAESIRESIAIILETGRNQRVMRPDFGADLAAFFYLPNTTTTRRLIQDRIAHALARWEPRITVLDVAVDADPDDRQAAVATVRFAVKDTGLEDSVQVSMSLPPAGGAG